MTATDLSEAQTAATPNPDWGAQIAALQRRYPKIREPILAALNILTGGPDLALDDAKAQAAANGVRITAASVAAARRLLSRQDGAPPVAASSRKDAPTRHRDRPARTAEPAFDVEALIRATVEKVQAQRDAEAARVREVVRRAVEMLQAAIA